MTSMLVSMRLCRFSRAMLAPGGEDANSSTFYRPPMSEEKYMHYQLTRPAMFHET